MKDKTDTVTGFVLVENHAGWKPQAIMNTRSAGFLSGFKTTRFLVNFLRIASSDGTYL